MNKGGMRIQTQPIINERSCGLAHLGQGVKLKSFTCEGSHVTQDSRRGGTKDEVSIILSPSFFVHQPPGTSITYESSKHGFARLAKISPCKQNGCIRWDGSESFLDEAANVESCLRARRRLRHHFQHRHCLRYHQSEAVGKVRTGCEEIWGWQCGGTPEMAFMSLTRTF